MADLAFGIDVSRYQGKINWDTIQAHSPKVVFSAIRATVSWGYRDSWFARNWSEAKRVGILRLAYHVIYPSENPQKQIDNFLGAVGNDLGELPLVLDIELDQGLGAAAITNSVLTHAQMIEARVGKKPILYSRKSFIDPYLRGATWLDNYDWWLALYSDQSGVELTSPPPLPNGVTKWLFHQTTGTGKPFGVESKGLDFDRWNGDEAAVYKYAGLTPTPPPTQPTWFQAIDSWARSKGFDGPQPPKG